MQKIKPYPLPQGRTHIYEGCAHRHINFIDSTFVHRRMNMQHVGCYTSLNATWSRKLIN